MIRSSVNLDCFISVSLKVTDSTHFWRKFRGSGQSVPPYSLLTHMMPFKRIDQGVSSILDVNSELESLFVVHTF